MKNMTAATRPGKQHLPDMPYYHYYTEAESTERYSQFPLIIEKFAFVRKYMKENYGIDLEAIAKGPNDWDIQPHPEIPGNNDEDGGDDDDPWPGFDW